MPDFTEIYDEHLWRVYGYIASRVANRADAEDLTQQTFERALIHWDEYDAARAKVTTWLIAIARNLMIDHHRAGSVRGSGPPLEALAESAPAAGAAPADAIGLDPQLAAALAELSERERELIALRYFADLTVPEIASVTSLTRANVRQILSRSQRRIRSLLDGATLGGADEHD